MSNLQLELLGLKDDQLAVIKCLPTEYAYTEADLSRKVVDDKNAIMSAFKPILETLKGEKDKTYALYKNSSERLKMVEEVKDELLARQKVARLQAQAALETRLAKEAEELTTKTDWVVTEDTGELVEQTTYDHSAAAYVSEKHREETKTVKFIKDMVRKEDIKLDEWVGDVIWVITRFAKTHGISNGEAIKQLVALRILKVDKEVAKSTLAKAKNEHILSPLNCLEKNWMGGNNNE